MITYGYSLQGKSHVKNGIVCQDSSKVDRLRAGLYMGIVADGVGSAAKSDIGSKMAVEGLFAYCNEHVKRSQTNEDLELILKEGYTYAMQQITDYAVKHGEQLSDFDTTLSSVLYNGEQVVFGHAGDGGIIARYNDGHIEPITERQKGADEISVRPLRAGESSWAFGSVLGNVASVLLVTDGMLDGVMQPNLLNLPKSKMQLVRRNYPKNHVYVTAAEFFMNPYCVFANSKVHHPEKLLQHFLQGNLSEEDDRQFVQCMQNGYDKMFQEKDVVELCQMIINRCMAIRMLEQVEDDKSLVCLINEKQRVQPQTLRYYREPNWRWLNDCMQALLAGTPTPPNPDIKIEITPPSGDPPKIVGSGGRKPPKPSRDIPKVECPVYGDTYAQRCPELDNTSSKGKHISVLIAVGAVGICFAMFAGGMLLGKHFSAKDTKQTQYAQESTPNVQPSASPEVTPTRSPNDNNMQKSEMQGLCYQLLSCVHDLEKSDITPEHAEKFWTMADKAGIQEELKSLADINKENAKKPKNASENDSNDNDSQSSSQDKPTSSPGKPGQNFTDRDVSHQTGTQSSRDDYLEETSSPQPHAKETFAPDNDDDNEQTKESDNWQLMMQLLQKVQEQDGLETSADDAESDPTDTAKEESTLKEVFDSLSDQMRNSVKKYLKNLWNQQNNMPNNQA